MSYADMLKKAEKVRKLIVRLKVAYPLKQGTMDTADSVYDAEGKFMFTVNFPWGRNRDRLKKADVREAALWVELLNELFYSFSGPKGGVPDEK